MESSEVRFQFGPPVRATFMGGVRHAQAGFLVAAFGSAVLFLRFVPGQIGVGIAVLLVIAGVAGAFGTIEGRPFDDWLPACSRFAMIVFRRKRRWRSPAPRMGERAAVPAVPALPSTFANQSTASQDAASNGTTPPTPVVPSAPNIASGPDVHDALHIPDDSHVPGDGVPDDRPPQPQANGSRPGRHDAGPAPDRPPLPSHRGASTTTAAAPASSGEHGGTAIVTPDHTGDGVATPAEDLSGGSEQGGEAVGEEQGAPPKRRRRWFGRRKATAKARAIREPTTDRRRRGRKRRRADRLAAGRAEAEAAAQADAQARAAAATLRRGAHDVEETPEVGALDVDGRGSRRNRRRGSGAGRSPARSGGPRRAGKPSPPPPIADWQLIYTSVSGQPMGVLRDRKNKTWVAVIGVQGQSFMLLDEGEQVRRLSSWAAVQASMARQGSPISRMQWMERTLPEVGDEMRSFFDDRAGAQMGTAAHDSYAELLVSAQPVTQQHETYLVLQVSMAKAARAIKHAGGGDRGAVAVLYRELDHLQRQLRESDLSVSGFLSGDELAMLIRTQFDPEDALAMATRQSTSDEPLVSARSAWPMATEVSWGHYRTDRIYHVTYWVSEWPKLGVRPSFLSPLLLTSNGVTRTVSVVSEPIPTAQAVRKVEHLQTARLSDDEIRTGAGYRTGARRRREAEALDRRENELADGHAENRYSGYVTVSGPNLDEVEVAAATIEQVAYQCPVELRRLWGEQDTAFYCTMPLTQGLT